jgi:hypothetical protein
MALLGVDLKSTSSDAMGSMLLLDIASPMAARSQR